MSRISSIVFVIFCLFEYSIASPLVHDVQTTESSFSIFNPIADFFSEVRQHISVISKKLFSDLSEKLNEFFGSVLKELFKPVIGKLGGLFLRAHVIAYAADELFDEKTAAENKERRVIAKTIAELWQKLSIMEEVDALLVNVTDEIVLSNETTAASEPAAVMKFMFRKLDEKFKNSPRLSPLYRELKRKTASATPSGGGTELKWDFHDPKTLDRFMKLANVKRSILNKHFVLNSRKHDAVKVDEKAKERYSLSRAILDVTKKNYVLGNELQSIYDFSLAEASNFVNMTSGLESGASELYSQLKNKIDANSALKLEVDTAKSKVLAHAATDGGYITDLEFALIL